MLAEKTKLMKNRANSIQRQIKVTCQKLGAVTGFKYTLGAMVSDEGSKPGSLLWIAQALHALTKLKPVWIKSETGALPCHIRISVCP